MTMTRFVIGSWFFLLPSVGLEAAEPDGSWGQEEVLQGCFGSQEDWQEHRDLHWPGGLHSPLRDESPCPLTLLIQGLHWILELHFLVRDG